MKREHVILFLILIAIPCFSQIGGRTQVAVMPLEASGIDPSAIISLTDRLRSELIGTGRFDVMDRAKMDEILREQGFQQSGTCSSTECLVQAGKMLGVARMIAGSVGRVGKVYTASARVIDIETGRVMISKTEDCRDCPIDEMLISGMRNLAQKLAGLAPGATQPGVVQPTFVDGRGDFYFKSDPPGAQVFIDNQPVEGVTPNSAEGAQAGMHVIRMATDEFTAQETVFLEPNEFKRVELKLKRATGGLKILTQPFEAAVFIDEQPRGVAPMTLTDLVTGEHAVRLSKEGYVDYNERIRIKANETARLEAKLTQWAYLTLDSSPAGAEVFIQGGSLGKTPLEKARIEPGYYQISVRLAGYAPYLIS